MNHKHQTLILVGIILISTYVVGQFSSGQPVIDETSGVEQEMQDVRITPDTSLALVEYDVLDDTTLVEKSSVPFEKESDTTSCRVSARIAHVENLSTGNVIYTKNAFIRWPIASITKLMSATIADDLLSATRTITITQEMIDRTEGYASFDAGETYSVTGLIAAMLVFSSNDAAFALADEVGEDVFVAAMNTKAQELGMSETRFSEPSGLSYLNQSTAQDVVKLLGYLYRQKPELIDYTRTKRIYLEEYEHGRRFTFTNINAFAGQKDFLGGKTGFIDESGGNLVTLFDTPQGPIAIIVFSSSDRFQDISTLRTCYE